MCKRDQLRLVFTGDIAFSNHFRDGWKTDCVCPGIKDYLQQADYVMANIEGPLTECEIDSKRSLNHKSDVNSGSYLHNLNINIWNLANNHIMDCGTQGLIDTLECGNNNGCFVIGAGKNVDEASTPIILGEQIKIGIISIAKPWVHIISEDDKPGAFTWEKVQLIAQRIGELRKVVDWIILVAHGGEEFSDLPFPYLRKLYTSWLDLGIDIIVSHHPHVVQNYEKVGKKAIFYSLGNFIFDTDYQRSFTHTENGMLLGIEFEKYDYRLDYMPVHIDRNRHIVDIGNCPVVFRDINSEDYASLWPLEARNYNPILYRLRKKAGGMAARIPKPFQFLVDIYSCRNMKGKDIQKGRMKAIRKEWRHVNLPDVIAYINE